MTTLLVLSNLALLTLALVLGALLVRKVHEERRRAGARAARLAELAGDPDVAPATPFDLRHAFRDEHVESEADAVPVTASPLFAQTEGGSPWLQRAVIIGGLAFIVTAGVLIVSSASERIDPSAQQTAGENTKPAEPLELRSLADTRDGETITISGLVQNPRDGRPLTAVTANVLLFSSDGALLARKQAPLDLETLTPGDQSGFTVAIRVPTTGTLARYRVSFRDQVGEVVTHIDRREGAPVARNE